MYPTDKTEASYLGEEKAVEKPSRLREEMERLAKEMETTSILVDRLDSRLVPLINSVPSTELQGGTTAEDILPPHIQDIKSRRQIAQSINNRLNHLLKNLEI